MDLMALHTAAVEMTSAQWSNLWLRAAGGERVEVNLPPFPPEDVQKITNNVSGVETMRGAAQFYRVADEEMTRCLSGNLADLKLLDFGAGWGRITRLFLRSIAPANLYGIDVDERLVGAGRDLLPGVSFERLASGGPLPYADGQFDVVVANSVFSHLSLDFHLFLHQGDRASDARWRAAAGNHIKSAPFGSCDGRRKNPGLAIRNFPRSRCCSKKPLGRNTDPWRHPPVARVRHDLRSGWLGSRSLGAALRGSGRPARLHPRRSDRGAQAKLTGGHAFTADPITSQI